MRGGRYDPIIFLLQSRYDKEFQTPLHSFHLWSVDDIVERVPGVGQ